MKPIPVSAAHAIAQSYDYDQVIVIARKVGKSGGEHVTTYGRTKEHCGIAARVGDFLKVKVMGWPQRHSKVPKGTISTLRSMVHIQCASGRNSCPECRALVAALNVVTEEP